MDTVHSLPRAHLAQQSFPPTFLYHSRAKSAVGEAAVKISTKMAMGDAHALRRKQNYFPSETKHLIQKDM